MQISPKITEIQKFQKDSGRFCLLKLVIWNFNFILWFIEFQTL